jgi:hypothetical protein
MKRMFFLSAVLAALMVCVAGITASAQERDTDTLKMVSRDIAAGDTAAVYLYMVNSEVLGGYSLRLEYDSLILGIPDPNFAPAYETVQLRGDRPTFLVNVATPGVVTVVGLSDFLNWTTMPIGSGNTIQFFFFVKPGVANGTTSQISFVDADYDTNAYNWFVNFDASTQYRPKRLTGTITVAAVNPNNLPTIDAISSPIEASVGVPVQFNVIARDADGDNVTLTAYDLPSGALFTPYNPVTGAVPLTGTFSWNPTAAAAGQHIVRFQADDGEDVSSSRYVTINVSAGGAPIIGALTTPISTTQGSLVEFTVQATDPDGEQVTLTASNLPSGATFSPSNPVVGTSSVSGSFRWSPSFSQSGAFVVQFRAKDADDNQSAISYVTIDVEEVQLDQLFTTSVDGQSPQGGVPGATDVIIPVNFVTTVATYGVQFDFVYDPAVFTVTDITPSDRLEGFTIYENIGETPGRIKVVAFDLSGNPIGGEGSVIFNIAGSIRPNAEPGRYNLMFEDAWESINPDPNVPSKQLATTGGHLYVDVLGDANLDGRIDVADAVAVVGYILGSFNLTDRQFRAANVVVDNYVDVYDLVGIINMIFGQPVQPAPFNDGEDVFAEVAFPYEGVHPDDGMFKLVATAPTEVAGIQAEIIYDPLQVKLVPPEPTGLATRLDYSYTDNGSGRMTVVMTYDPTDPSTVLPSGENEIFGLRIAPGPAGVEGDLPPVKLRNIKLCTPEASKILVDGYADVPRAFELFQNYPNPFNPRTVIEFNLAPQGEGAALIDTRLSVYNILGRRVATLIDGPLAPGRHSVEWLSKSDDGQTVGSGIYFYKLTAGQYSEAKKMVLMK